MAQRKALVVKATGSGLEEKPATDTIDGLVSYAAAQSLTAAQQAQARANLGTHAVFTGTLAVPATALGGASNATVTMSPAVTGDALATTDNVTIHFRVAIPTGMNVASWVVTATNQITIYFTANALITAGSSVAVVAVAHR